MNARRRVVMVATLAAVFGATVSVVQWGPSMAQFAGGGTQVEVVGAVTVTGEVQSYPPDGGTEVFIPSRVDTNITNDYVPIGMGVGAPKIEAEVSGDLGGPVTTSVVGPVEISGYSTVPTFNLTPETYALLAGQRTCVDYAIGNRTLSGVMTTFPAAPVQPNAAINAAITVHGFSPTVEYVACWRASQADGGPPPSCTPDAGVANVPLHAGSTWIVDGLGPNDIMRCLTCTHAGPPGGEALAGGAISVCTPSL